MPITGLDHFTLRCQPHELQALSRFYVDVLGLEEGPRAEFDFDGQWLHANGKAIVHLAAVAKEGACSMPSATGRLDHISFFALDLLGFRQRLQGLRVPFHELPVPGLPLHQVFVTDPTGLKIELTFTTIESTGAGS